MREPRTVDLRGDPPDPEQLAGVLLHLRGGGLVVMPTETVYGFGCTLQKRPLERLQRLKERGPEKPFLVLVPGMDSVPELSWSEEARKLAEIFWPGALTLVLRDPVKRFPSGVRSPGGTVALRVSPHPLARAVVEGVGEPLVSTSANRPGETPARSASEARHTALSLGTGEELWIVDGGTLSPSAPSTIVDCTGPEPAVRRAGAVPVHRIRCVLPEIHAPS